MYELVPRQRTLPRALRRDQEREVAELLHQARLDDLKVAATGGRAQA
jgi:hypothetical protein